MEKIVSARHFHLHDDLKQRLQDQLVVIETAHPKLTSARVIVDHQKGHFATEVLIHGRHTDIEATATDPELELSLQSAMDRAETQLQRHYEKIKNHHHKAVSALECEVEGVTDPNA